MKGDIPLDLHLIKGGHYISRGRRVGSETPPTLPTSARTASADAVNVPQSSFKVPSSEMGMEEWCEGRMKKSMRHSPAIELQ